MSITASIPPVFAAYATLAFPLGLDVPRDLLRPREDRFDDTLLRVLSAHTEPQPWWLGFLETGASDVVLDKAPRVYVYSNWPYVLVQAGPQEARNWRSDEGRWHTALPELMFPADHSWLLSSLWDDAWAGVGGSDDLISGSNVSAHRVKCTLTCSARSANRRSQPRTVSAGTPNRPAIGRYPAPATFASIARPITDTSSRRRSTQKPGSNTCVPAHPRHRARRGRSDQSPAAHRTTRRRA
jgi:hypothetical protein